MSAAFTLMLFAALVFMLMLVVGVRVLVGGVRLAVWLVSTRAGWITAGLTAIVYLLLTVGW